MSWSLFDHYAVCRREDGTPWELGRGALGVTYKARDVNLECPVVLRVVEKSAFKDEDSRSAFLRDARAAAALRHRNVAAVLHLGTDEERLFVASEYVKGETAEALVTRTGPLPPETALRIAAQAARALAAAARQNLLHRDLTPARLMLTHEHAEADEGVLVKVIGFGHSSPAGVGGSACCISPEQAAERPLDPRSDIYSLGCTLWFLLTGASPFAGADAEVRTQRARGDLPWAALEKLPSPVQRLLRIMLRTNPAERPRDALEAQRAIEICLGRLERGQTLAARLGDSMHDTRRWLSGRPRFRLTIAAGTLALLAIAGVTALSDGDQTPPRLVPGPGTAPATPLPNPYAHDAEYLASTGPERNAGALKAAEPEEPSPAPAPAELPIPTQTAPTGSIQDEAPPSDVAGAPAPEVNSDASGPMPVTDTQIRQPVRSSAKTRSHRSGNGLSKVGRSVRGFFSRIF